MLVVDGLCSSELVGELRSLVEAIGERQHTSAYVDDMFEERRGMEEDAHLLWSAYRSGVDVPREYRTDPLRCYLWAATTCWERLPQGSLQRAQLSVARRAWQTQWDPADIARSGFRKAAERWKVPECALRRLAPLVVRVLGTGVRGLAGSEELGGSIGRSGASWVLRDSTVVKYSSGESQVPHVDTCDLTLLVYLSDGGGATCFPNMGRKVTPAAGRVLLFFSTVLGTSHFGGFAGAAFGSPNDATMHYGGPSDVEEKMVVQLLLSAEGVGAASQWRDVLKGKLFQGEATITHGQRASALDTRDAEEGLRLGLPLSAQRCASGCKDRALELGVERPRYCIWCWNKWLERALANGAPPKAL